MALQLLSKCPRFPLAFQKNVSSSFSSMAFHRHKSQPLLLTRIKNFTSSRSFFYKLLLKPSAETLQRRDGVPQTYNMIYRNSMYRYVLLAQAASFGTAVVVALWVGFATIYNDDPKTKWDQIDGSDQNELLVYIVAFIVFIVALQVMIVQLPIRIYSKPTTNDYVLMFYGLVPGTKKFIDCNVNQIRRVQGFHILPWKDNILEIVHKQRIIVFEQFFRRPVDYNIMSGYQKPDN